MLKYLLPFGVLRALEARKHGAEFAEVSLLFRDGYFTDLTKSERFALLACLLELERNSEEVRYLEIGVWAGGNIKFLKERSKKTSFTGIDLFEDFRVESGNTHTSPTFSISGVQGLLGKDVVLRKGDSKTILTDMARSGCLFDEIFIDGNHTFEASREDFLKSVPLLKKGGYIALHNCSVGHEPDSSYIVADGGPWRLVREISSMPGYASVLAVDRIQIFQKL